MPDRLDARAKAAGRLYCRASVSVLAPAPPGDVLHCPFGQLSLACYQPPPRAPVRAWDAADEYVLAELAERGLPGDCRPIIANDRAGALAVALRAYRPISWSDSRVSHLALAANLARNGALADSVAALPSTTAPTGPCQLALIKVPKSLALLETQLHALRPVLHAGSAILGAGMTRHVRKATLDCFARILGPVETSLARKKARLIRVAFDPALTPPPAPEPIRWTLDNPALGVAMELENRANVFSRKRLDLGTRLLLDHFPECSDAADIVDLGCGNGALGCVAAHRAPAAHILFTDESYLAVASARANFARAFPGREARAHFAVEDCLGDVAPASADVILCNPPFHQQHAVGVHVATRMFHQAAGALRPDGRLIVVGNRHLPYPRILRDCFARVRTVTGDRKFLIVHASRPRPRARLQERLQEQKAHAGEDHRTEDVEQNPLADHGPGIDESGA